MRKPDTPYTGWTRETGYPKASRQSGALVVTDRFYCDAAGFDFDMLADLESLEFMGLPVLSSDAEPSVDGGKIFVKLVYSRPSGSGGSPARDGVSEYTFEDSGEELPIDMRKSGAVLRFKNYKTCHNYALAARDDESPSPDWWAKATDTVLVDKGSYRWVKDSSDLPGPEMSGQSLLKWHIVKEKTKRIESVPVPAPVVVETTRYQNYNQAVAAKKALGKRLTPARTFGETGEWLVMSSTIAPDGRRWVVTTRYQCAPEWDHDYYDAGS